MTPVILASQSAARASLLSAAGLAFERCVSGVDEDALKHDLLERAANPHQIATALAQAKAQAVSRDRPGLVIGADQTLELDGALIDKAPSLDEARARLIQLRGRTHSLHAAVVLADAGQVLWSHVESANLTMRSFSDDFLGAYLNGHGQDALSCVGGYALEAGGIQLFDHIDGDYFAILGLPLLPLLAQLRACGALAE